MKAYSTDLRERVVAAVDHREGSLRQIARRFRIAVKTLSRWLQQRRRTGTLAPKPHGGGRSRAVDAQDAERLEELVQQRPDATLDELNEALGLGCSRMAILRALRRLRISRKKKVVHASERDTPRVKRKRREFRRRLAEVAPEHLVFVDETGANTAMTRRYGRAPIGQRVEGAVPGQVDLQQAVTSAKIIELRGKRAPILRKTVHQHEPGRPGGRVLDRRVRGALHHRAIFGARAACAAAARSWCLRYGRSCRYRPASRARSGQCDRLPESPAWSWLAPAASSRCDPA